jgi:hypothetical protein
MKTSENLVLDIFESYVNLRRRKRRFASQRVVCEKSRLKSHFLLLPDDSAKLIDKLRPSSFIVINGRWHPSAIDGLRMNSVELAHF